MSSGPSISVVVCTYNRAHLLRECLQPLVEQLRNQPVELIVVDNNSTDATAKVAAEALAGAAEARVIRETSQGLSFARNRGYREARAPWVAYIDDDAVVQEGYVRRALETIALDQFDAFGGTYVPWYREGRVPWFKDEYASNAGQRATRGLLADKRFFSGGNCLFRISVLEELGGFPVTIGMRGAVRSYGEETFVQMQMRKRGLRVGFDPDLVVKHLVPRHKMKLASLLRDSYCAGRDSWRAFEQDASLRAKAAIAAYAMTRLPLRIGPSLLKLAQPDYYVQNFIWDTCADAAYQLGQIVSPGR